MGINVVSRSGIVRGGCALVLTFTIFTYTEYLLMVVKRGSTTYRLDSLWRPLLNLYGQFARYAYMACASEYEYGGAARHEEHEGARAGRLEYSIRVDAVQVRFRLSSTIGQECLTDTTSACAGRNAHAKKSGMQSGEG